MALNNNNSCYGLINYQPCHGDMNFRNKEGNALADNFVRGLGYGLGFGTGVAIVYVAVGTVKTIYSGWGEKKS